MFQYALMDAMDEHVGPGGPVPLWMQLEAIPGASFQSSALVRQADQSELAMRAS
jgi:hypothetical protein